MYQIRRIVLLLTLINLIFSVTTQAQEIREYTKERKVVLGVVEFPPLVIKNTDGVGCHGLAVETSIRVLEYLGYSVSVECPPPARLFERIRKGQVDITVNVRGTTALDNNVTFVKKPFSFLSLMLMTNPKLEQQKTVAAIRGYDYVGLRQELESEGYIFIDMANSTDAIQMFQFGRTTHLATYEGPYNYHVQHSPNPIQDVAISIRKDIPTFFSISNSSRIKEPLLKEINTMLNTAKEKTVIDFIESKRHHTY